MSTKNRLKLAIDELATAVEKRNTSYTAHWSGRVVALAAKLVEEAMDDVKYRHLEFRNIT